MSGSKKKIIVDGAPLMDNQASGVGFYLRGMVENSPKDVDVTIFGSGSKNNDLLLGKKVKFKNIRIPNRVLRGLSRRNLFPPLNFFLRGDVYLFANYESLPTYRVMTCVAIYDLCFIRHPEMIEPKNLQHLRKAVPKSINKSDFILTISNFTKKEIMEAYNFPESRIIVAEPSIDKSHYYERTMQEIKNVKDMYSLKSEYILFVGNTEPRKNLARLIDSYIECSRENPDIPTLVLAGGSGWLNDDILNKISLNSSIIKKIGYVKEEHLPALYSGSLAFVYVPLYEGYGIPPLEAMACGTPVIASNNTSVPEATRGASIDVDPRNGVQIKEAIREISGNKNLRDKLRKMGIERVSKTSWEEKSSKLMHELASKAESFKITE